MYNLLSLALLTYAFVFKRSSSASVSVGSRVMAQVDERSYSKSPDFKGFKFLSAVVPEPSKLLSGLKRFADKPIVFSDWLDWVVAPVINIESVPSEVSILIDGKSIKPYPFDKFERKTDSLSYDVRMKFFSELVSIDDKGNYLPPVVFKIGSLFGEHYGAVSNAVSQSVLDRVVYVKSYAPPSKDFNKYKNELIQVFTSLYLSIIGRPAHNSFAVPWSVTGPQYSFLQQNLQAYLWYVLDKEVNVLTSPAWKAACSPVFPLPFDVNSKLSDKRGFPKVRSDGSSRLVFDSDSVGIILFRDAVDKKFFNGKLAVYSEIINKNKEKNNEK